uniref:Uncharacterized protein n=1 Tax=Arundo donax TaxID=35708 RepID=A0A0A8YZ14_ARUDO
MPRKKAKEQALAVQTEFKEYKIKSQAQFEDYGDKVKTLETTRDALVSTAQPILNALVPVEEGASPISMTRRLEAAPDMLNEVVKEIATSSAC